MITVKSYDGKMVSIPEEKKRRIWKKTKTYKNVYRTRKNKTRN